MQIHDFDQRIDRRGTGSEKWDRYPADVLPMWVADSDFTAPQPVRDALAGQVRHGVFGYPHMDGLLAEAAVHWMRTRFAWEVDPSHVCFSPGVSAALALAINAFAGPGEGVLLFTPTYPPFLNLPIANGREALASPLLRERDWTIDWDDLEAKARKAKLLLLCSPQNPTGRVFTREELTRIGELCLTHNIVVLSDEVHCDYIAPGKQHLPFASLAPDLGNICLTALNPSKTFNIAGLQAAAVIAGNDDLRERFRAATRKAGLWGNSPGVVAFHAAYMRCAWYADQVNAYTRKNLEKAVSYIQKRIPGIAAYVPEATYLLWLDCRGLGLGHEDLRDFFLRKARVALNSGLDFGPEGRGFMRMNLACPASLMREGLQRIEKAAATL